MACRGRSYGGSGGGGRCSAEWNALGQFVRFIALEMNEMKNNLLVFRNSGWSAGWLVRSGAATKGCSAGFYARCWWPPEVQNTWLRGLTFFCVRAGVLAIDH